MKYSISEVISNYGLDMIAWLVFNLIDCLISIPMVGMGIVYEVNPIFSNLEIGMIMPVKMILSVLVILLLAFMGELNLLKLLNVGMLAILLFNSVIFYMTL